MNARTPVPTPAVSALLALVTSISFALPAVAIQGANAPTFEKVSGPERIDQAGKLHMLSQRIPAATCNAAAGIGGWEAKGYLSASISEFDRILNALEFGDAFIQIRAAEQDPRILERLAEVNDTWRPMRDDLVPLASQENDTFTLEQATVTASQAEALADISETLVGDLIGEYADPAEFLATDAMALNFVSRQRMIPQVISKTACMIAEGTDAKTAREDLLDAMGLYEATMSALLTGMPAVGIRPPANDDIANGLREISARWQAVRPLLDRLEAGDTLSHQDRETIYSEMNHLTAMMNEVSADYAKASRKLL